MIAKSDLIILVVSSTLLGIAVYRWDQNTRNVDTSTVLANTTATAPASSTNSGSTGQTLTATALDADTGTSNGSSSQYIDPQSVAPSAAVEPVVVETVDVYSTYTVRSGDSLSEIASRYNTTVNELQSINGINGSTIFIGQEIQYPNN